MNRFFNYINNFLRKVLPDFIIDILKSVYLWISLYVLKIINFFIGLSHAFIDSLNSLKESLLSQFSQYWNMMPHDVIQLLTFFNIPLSMSILLSALAIRFIIRLIPLVG